MESSKTLKQFWFNVAYTRNEKNNFYPPSRQTKRGRWRGRGECWSLGMNIRYVQSLAFFLRRIFDVLIEIISTPFTTVILYVSYSCRLCIFRDITNSLLRFTFKFNKFSGTIITHNHIWLNIIDSLEHRLYTCSWVYLVHNKLLILKKIYFVSVQFSFAYLCTSKIELKYGTWTVIVWSKSHIFLILIQRRT